MSSVASTSAGSSTLGQGTSLSGGISFAGLGSGTDFQSMIDQLKKGEEIPKKRLELWRADWQRRVDAFDVLLEEIGTLSESLGKMDSMSTFLTKLVGSTNSTAVTAAANADAPLGAHKINVTQLATNAVLTTRGIIDGKDAVVASGSNFTFAYTYGTEDPNTPDNEAVTRTLTIPQGTSLQSFVNIINNDTRNPGVSATLIKSGDGYVFQLMGKETGEEHALAIDGTTDMPDFLNDPGVWYEREAQDAEFYLDGRQQQRLTSASNSLTEVIPGLTVTLTDVTDELELDTNGDPILDSANNTVIKTSRPVMLTVTNDAASAKTRIAEFVDGVNQLLAKFQELTKVDKSKKIEDPTKAASQFSSEKGSVLTGNYGVQLLNSKIKSLCVSTGKGFQALEANGTGDVFWALSTIGITMDSDESSKTFGQLVIKEGESEDDSPFRTLDEALAEDPEAVAELLAGDKIVRSNSPDFSYVGMLWKESVKGGEHSVRWQTAGGDVTDVWIDGAKAGYDASTGEWTSTAEGSRGLVIRVDNPLADGNHTGSFSVKQGKLNELNELCKAELKGANLEVGINGQTDEKGSLHVLRENYLDIIEGIDKKIEQEETRLIRWETRMRAQFSRLDTLLSNYNNQMQSNAAALASASKDYSGKK